MKQAKLIQNDGREWYEVTNSNGAVCCSGPDLKDLCPDCTTAAMRQIEAFRGVRR